MRRAIHSGGGALVALACAAAIAGLSRFSWEAGAEDRARLRLSWQSTSVRVEACRTPTDEELAGLPPHMRMREICEGRLLPFRLHLWIDGALRIDARIRPKGVRGDRPLSILREIAIAPGVHELRVAFEPEHEELPSERTEAEGALALTATVELAPREVALVTRAADAGALVLRAGAPGPDVTDTGASRAHR